MKMKPSAMLNKAADLIANKGWCQKKYHLKGDGYCMLGAIFKVAGSSDEELLSNEHSRACDDSVRTSLRFLELLTSWIAYEWNDRQGRTKREVVAVLRKAAKNAKAQGL